MQELQFKVQTYRKLPNPFSIYKNSRMKEEIHEILVNVKDLPEGINLKTNPRVQNMNTKTVQKIKEGLMTDNRAFHLLNRGIVLSASEVKQDTVNGILLVNFRDLEVHGNIDGGHTYKVILENRSKMNHDQFVKVEILTGIEDIFEDVAAARNTSVQVKDSSIAELKKKFEFIKVAIETEPYANNIAYKDNEDKDIDIKEIISILTMFNIENYPGRDLMPTKAFNSQQSCVNDFIKIYDNNLTQHTNQSKNPYFKMTSIIKDIFELHDEIEKNMDKFYRLYFGTGTKFGRTKGIVVANTNTKFYSIPIEYRIPKAFIYPILGSFRALIKEENGIYLWKADPFRHLNELGKDLVGETIERSRTLGNNPVSVGKDAGHWKQLYQNVLTNYLLESQ